MAPTPKDIFETEIAKHLKENPEATGDVTAIYQFEVSGDNGGDWYIELNGENRQVVCGKSEKPSCVITIADSDLVNLVQGSLKPQLAFMTGRLKVKGDLGLALKLGSILKTDIT